MKALSLRQPWAQLILDGKKIYETRTWNTKFRGEFLIHAAKTIDKKSCKHFNIDPDKLITGAIIGKATLVRVISYKTKKEFDKDCDKHYVPKNAEWKNKKCSFVLEKVKPIHCKGKLNFFEVLK